MIGSLLYFVLYPLARFASGRRAESLTECPRPAEVNGKAVSDGVCAPTRLDPAPASSGQTGQGVKMNEDKGIDAPCEGPKNGEHVETNGEHKAALHEENQEDSNKYPEQANQQTTVSFQKLHVEEVGPEEVLEYVDKKNAEVAKCPTESITEGQCWDEYAVSQSVTQYSSPSFTLTSLLSDSEKEDGRNQYEQSAWQSPGLAQETPLPLWQFPTMSYYPSLQQMAPFEVTWRLWEEEDDCAHDAHLPHPKAAFDFTVMSYNILAQDLLEAHPHLYSHCPLEVLDWSYRCTHLLQEIEKWAPDIFCLQEVQENHYYADLHPALSEMGYTCVYKRRTGNKTDGCATCYRGDRFSEISVTLLEFFKPETGLLDRHNVGIVLLLRPVLTQGSKVSAKGLPLCVANTHLLFNPRRGDVKLAQLGLMLAEIDRAIRYCKVNGEACNVIFCGDFNCVPHMPLYQLITTGRLYYVGLPAWQISGQEDMSYRAVYHRLFAPLWPTSMGVGDNCQYSGSRESSLGSGRHQYSRDLLLQLRYCPMACVRPARLELIPGVTDDKPDISKYNLPDEQRFRCTISHKLDLQSAYKHFLPGSGQAEVTTLHSDVGATVDYIFYTPKRTPLSDCKGLKLMGCLSLPSEDALWSINGLPSHIFPSDHLSLLAKFQLLVDAEI